MTITVTVSYPNTPGSKFDMDYYLGTHLELVGKCWGDKLISARAIKRVSLRPTRARRRLTKWSQSWRLKAWRSYKMFWKRTERRSWATFRTSPMLSR